MSQIIQHADGTYFKGYDNGRPVWTSDKAEAKDVDKNKDDLIITVLERHANFDIIERNKSSNDRLKEFAKTMIEDVWNERGGDCFAIQDAAEAFGLIVKVPYDLEKHGENNCDVQPGDDWFVLNPEVFG